MLDVQGLRAGYGQSEVLHGIDFAVAPGEVVVFVGRNGMGKTTLMRSLIGLMPATAGRIVLDSADIAPLKTYQRVARSVAFVPQGRMVLPAILMEGGAVVHGSARADVDEDRVARYLAV